MATNESAGPLSSKPAKTRAPPPREILLRLLSILPPNPLTFFWLILLGIISAAPAIAASRGRGTVPSMLAVLLTWWPYYVRLTRGEVLAIKHQPYVVAARAAGTSETRILFRHVLRNLIEPLLVYYTLDIGTVIVTFSTISFVGIGVPLDVPEWGTMVESYERFLLTLPWTVLSAGAAIFVTVLAFSLFGDGLRDILDPRSRRALVQAAIPSTLPAKAFVAAEA